MSNFTYTVVEGDSFDIYRYLNSKGSFLRDYKVDGMLFSDYLGELCSLYNISPRMVLLFLDLASGLVSRKNEPDDKILNRCMGQPGVYSNSIRQQLVRGVRVLRKFYDEGKDNQGSPLKDGCFEIVPQTPDEYALWSYKLSFLRDVTAEELEYRIKKLFN